MCAKGVKCWWNTDGGAGSVVVVSHHESRLVFRLISMFMKFSATGFGLFH